MQQRYRGRRDDKHRIHAPEPHDAHLTRVGPATWVARRRQAVKLRGGRPHRGATLAGGSKGGASPWVTTVSTPRSVGRMKRIPNWPANPTRIDTPGCRPISPACARGSTRGIVRVGSPEITHSSFGRGHGTTCTGSRWTWPRITRP